MGFQNANENELEWFWKFGHLALEKFWKSSEIISKRVYMNPGYTMHTIPMDVYVTTGWQYIDTAYQIFLFNYLH